jgi:hypothetical protein
MAKGTKNGKGGKNGAAFETDYRREVYRVDGVGGEQA